MAESPEFDAIAVRKMLEVFRRTLSSDRDGSGDAGFVGTILERNLRTTFDLSQPVSRFKEKSQAPEQKKFDMSFLMVTEANRALKDHRPDLAIGFVERALALWSDNPAAR